MQYSKVVSGLREYTAKIKHLPYIPRKKHVAQTGTIKLNVKSLPVLILSFDAYLCHHAQLAKINTSTQNNHLLFFKIVLVCNKGRNFNRLNTEVFFCHSAERGKSLFIKQLHVLNFRFFPPNNYLQRSYCHSISFLQVLLILRNSQSSQ